MLPKSFHEIFVFQHMQRLAFPATEKISCWDAEIRVIKRFLTLEQFKREIEDNELHCCILVTFEKLHVLLYNFIELYLLLDFIYCDEEVVGDGNDCSFLFDGFADADTHNSFVCFSEVGRISNAWIY